MEDMKEEKVKKEDTCRVILNVPKSLDDKFRELALKRGMPKSNMIMFAMSWYLDYSKTLDLMPAMLEGLKQLEKEDKKDQ